MPSDAPGRPARALPLVVFLAGVGTLGVEMIASRLLAPFFGTSQPIWAAVIGLTLIYLAAGYQIGGRLADRRPSPRLLHGILLAAGLLTAAIPLIARPILSAAQSALGSLDVGGFLGALVGVLLLFAAPVTLLATVSPFAVRLRLAEAERGVASAGATVGSLSALSTVGSIVGTFLTVLVLIPWVGTAATTLIYAGLLVLLGAAGLGGRGAAAGLLIFAALAGLALAGGGQVKAAGCQGCTVLAERESASNYIQVAQRPAQGSMGVLASPETVLMLNEGLAVHSVYNQRYAETGDARDLLTGGGPWDYFAVAPFLYPGREERSVTSMALLGAGAGTAASQFLAIYGPQSRVDAVEIDPDIIALGRQYFGLRDSAVDPAHPNFHAYAADARYWLATRGGRYDVVAIDAYHQPYIPFHLTTVEFFGEVRRHLTDEGVAVVNAGLGPDGDDRLSQAIAATMRAVFPQVFVIETARGGNQILVGVNRPVGDGWANMAASYDRVRSPALRQVLETVGVSQRAPDLSVAPLTDDRAPVEALVDSMIFSQVQAGP